MPVFLSIYLSLFTLRRVDQHHMECVYVVVEAPRQGWGVGQLLLARLLIKQHADV
jgi:GNAT superfamily N-acetyltransferase